MCNNNANDMRVVLISFSQLSTLQRYLYLLQEELVKLGVDAWTIGSSEISINIKLSSHNKCVETPKSPVPSFASIRKYAKHEQIIIEQIKRIRPKCIHFVNKHIWNYLLILKIKREMPNVTIVHTFHDPIGHAGDSVQLGVCLYHKMVSKHIDGIVVHSDIAMSQLQKHIKPNCDTCQAPLGVVEWRPFQAPRGSLRALIFGRINKYKGIQYYSEILDYLYKINPNITVIIAGKASREISKRQLKSIELRHNCILKNYYISESEIDSLFYDSDIVLIPYKSITQSGVILDAYCRSKTVIAFDIPGVSQYVPDLRLRVPAYNCEQFSETIAAVLGDQSLLLQLSRNSWEYGYNNYMPSSMAKSIKNFYMELLSEQRSYN